MQNAEDHESLILMIEGFVKSPIFPLPVIPGEAGMTGFRIFSTCAVKYVLQIFLIS